jgi:Flp pilus assembly pilin Flp
MTEYTLVVAAIAVAVFGAYMALGNNIAKLSTASIPL